MSKELEKELEKVTKERDAARSHNARLRRQLGGAYSLLAAHGIDIMSNDPELQLRDE